MSSRVSLVWARRLTWDLPVEVLPQNATTELFGWILRLEQAKQY